MGNHFIAMDPRGTFCCSFEVIDVYYRSYRIFEEIDAMLSWIVPIELQIMQILFFTCSRSLQTMLGATH